MLFNSYTFLFAFLPATLGGFFLLGRISGNLAAGWLAVASLAFYAWWGPSFTLILVASIGFNYIMSRRISATDSLRARYYLLCVAVATDLIVLAYFKYAHFLVSSIMALARLHVEFDPIIMPLGISFFTFTQIAFIVDTYNCKVREHKFLNYVLFVTYFPHLIAGPVLHHAEMMPQFQLRSTYRFSSSAMAVGLAVFAIGLAKKTGPADYFASFSNQVFAHAQSGVTIGTAQAWIGALSYTYQIYFDFSGYSDMAIGLALMMGLRLPLNFNSPYKAVNIVDFWHRWHITLSRFLRDYLYIPLGGNRLGHWRRYSNLMMTMLLGGLWHGAGWTFVIWGGLHGMYLIINHVWQAIRPASLRITGVTVLLAQSITFLGVAVAWVFFRASDLETAGRILWAMAGGELVWRGPLQLDMLTVGIGLLFAHAVVLLAPNTQELVAGRPVSSFAVEPDWLSWRPQRWHAVAAGLLLGFGLLTLSQTTDFIYFNF